LILDLQPDSFDDVEMLEIINQISKNSIVIGTGDSSPEYKIKELLEEKVQYFLMKPVKKYILLERIKFLLKERKKEKFELFTNCENYVKNIKKKRESIIIKFLYQIGASPSMKGFEYLKDAIYYAMDEKNVPYKNNKSIYNILENLHNQDSVSIGKSMKRVVDLICIKNKDNKKLSNLEFISKSALNLRLKMM